MGRSGVRVRGGGWWASVTAEASRPSRAGDKRRPAVDGPATWPQTHLNISNPTQSSAERVGQHQTPAQPRRLILTPPRLAFHDWRLLTRSTVYIGCRQHAVQKAILFAPQVGPSYRTRVFHWPRVRSWDMSLPVPARTGSLRHAIPFHAPAVDFQN